MRKKTKPTLHLGMIGATGNGVAALNAAVGRRFSPPNDDNDELRPYVATLRRWPSRTIWVRARNGSHAKELLEKQYGAGNVILIRETDEIPRASVDA